MLLYFAIRVTQKWQIESQGQTSHFATHRHSWCCVLDSTATHVHFRTFALSHFITSRVRTRTTYPLTAVIMWVRVRVGVLLAARVHTHHIYIYSSVYFSMDFFLWLTACHVNCHSHRHRQTFRVHTKLSRLNFLSYFAESTSHITDDIPAQTLLELTLKCNKETNQIKKLPLPKPKQPNSKQQQQPIEYLIIVLVVCKSRISPK